MRNLTTKLKLESFAVVMAFILPVLLALFLWKIGILNESAKSEKVAVALITLGGIFFSGILGLIGILIKQTIDQRTISINSQAEKRLRLEAAIKILELIKVEENEEDIRQTREASLHALLSLEELDLALNLTNNFWSEDLIDSKTAIKVIDIALKSDLVDVQKKGSRILSDNFKKLVKYNEDENEGYFLFPECVYLKWRFEINSNVRYSLMLSLFKIFAEKPQDYWSNSVLNQFVYSLYKIFISDDSERIKLGAAYCAVKLLEDFDDYTFAPPDIDSISIKHIRDEALKLAPHEIELYGRITDETYKFIVKIYENN